MSKNVAAALTIFETVDRIMDISRSNFVFTGTFKQQRTRGIYLCTNKGEYGSVLRLFIRPEAYTFSNEVLVRIAYDPEFKTLKLIANDIVVTPTMWYISELTIPSLQYKIRVYRKEGLAASFVNYVNNSDAFNAYPLIPHHFAFFAELRGSMTQPVINDDIDNEDSNDETDDLEAFDPNSTARSYWTHSIRARRLPMKSINMYEVLGVFPSKFYLDIDKLKPEDMVETIHQVVDILKLLFMTEFEYQLNDIELRILRSFPDKTVEDKITCSFHIIVHAPKTFASIDELGSIVKTYFKDIPCVDKSVYSFLQKMRIPGSTKTNNDRRCFQPVALDDLFTPMVLTEDQMQEYMIQVPRQRQPNEFQKPLLAAIQKLSPTTVEKVLPDEDWERIKGHLIKLIEDHPTRNWSKTMMNYLVSKIKSIEDSIRGYEFARYLIDISNETTKQNNINLDNRPEQTFNKLSTPNRVNNLWKRAIVEETTVEDLIKKFQDCFIYDNTVELDDTILVNCNSTFFSEDRFIRYTNAKLNVITNRINSTAMVFVPVRRTFVDVCCKYNGNVRNWHLGEGPVFIHVKHHLYENTAAHLPQVHVEINGHSKYITISNWNDWIAGTETITFEFTYNEVIVNSLTVPTLRAPDAAVNEAHTAQPSNDEEPSSPISEQPQPVFNVVGEENPYDFDALLLGN